VTFATAVHLSAGALTATLDGPRLREVCVAGERVLDSLYIAVRDTNWNTVPARVIRQEVASSEEEFQVELGLRHSSNEVDFECSASIAARPGTLSVGFFGEALGEFDANRIGLCLIHPIELAGLRFKAATADGDVQACFPEQISPTSLASNLRSLAYVAASGLDLEIKFGGALFEIEDHRNWTDPGWKTYSLSTSGSDNAIHMRPGDKVAQQMSLQWSFPLKRHVTSRTRPQATVHILDRVVGSVPEIGLMTSPATDMSVLAAIRPSTVHVDLVESQDWRDELACVAGHAGALQIGLTATLVGSEPMWIASVTEAIFDAKVPITRMEIVDPINQITSAGSASLVRQLMRDRDAVPLVGGGSRLHFAQLNRMSTPAGEWDYVTFPANPQAHHTDDASVMSTVLAQPATVDSARLLSGGLPVAVAPVALRPRLSPVSPSVASDPTDQREWSAFGAAWLMAAIAAMRAARWLTVMWDLSDQLVGTPAEQTLATVAQMQGLPILEVKYDPRRFSALAVRTNQATTALLVANLTPDSAKVHVAGTALNLSGYAIETVTLTGQRRDTPQ
jgi:hypothetical protein